MTTCFVHFLIENNFNKVVDFLPVIRFSDAFDVLDDEVEADILQSLAVEKDGLAEEVCDVGP